MAPSAILDIARNGGDLVVILPFAAVPTVVPSTVPAPSGRVHACECIPERAANADTWTR
jgi:hypothetical protein